VKRRLELFAVRFALALASLSLASTARAEGQRPALALAWSAPHECPQAAGARQLVAGYLGEARLAAPSPNTPVLRATATIRHKGHTWELKLATELDGEPGERTLEAGTCADVAAAGALVLAFAIDPSAALRHGAPVEPAEPREPALPAAQVPPPSPPPPVVLGAGAGVRGDLGALPRASVGLAFSLLVERGAWSGMVSGFVFAARSQATAAEPSAGGDLSLWSIAAAPCVAPAYREDLRLHLCVPLEWQRLRASGYGVEHPAVAIRSELLLGVELSPGLRLSPHFELVAPLRVGVALLRPEFYLVGIDSVFRASLVQGRAGVGILARF
jgi:hypothetical protein